jgi:SAM-dependent methyltransferase/uncharacterized protein YbaR (Trm112 family)
MLANNISRQITVDPWLLSRLACPVDYSPLGIQSNTLRCAHSHSFPVVDGVPVLLKPGVSPEVDIAPLDANTLEAFSSAELKKETIDAYVQSAVAATNGIMYRSVLGRLKEYPIPKIPLPAGGGKTLLDIGCNWGRWSIAARRMGYQAIGIDPNPEAIFAAKRVADQLGIPSCYVIADGRHLPFTENSFDFVFSYSVLQHFDRRDVRQCLEGVTRCLKENGRTLVQMASGFGLRGIFHQLRRGFREAKRFDVRYWKPQELKQTWEELVGPTELRVDGFFTLNPQPEEAHLLPWRYRTVVSLSEGLKRASDFIPPLIFCADSLFISSTKGPLPVRR